MVKRFDFHQDYKYAVRSLNKHGKYVQYVDYQKLEAENARLRQQRDAANAQLDFILENTK